MKNFFIREIPSEVLVEMKRKGTTHVAELKGRVDASSSYLYKLLDKFEEAGIVMIGNRGKGEKNRVELTEFGESITEDIEQFKRDVCRIEE